MLGKKKATKDQFFLEIQRFSFPSAAKSFWEPKFLDMVNDRHVWLILQKQVTLDQRATSYSALKLIRAVGKWQKWRLLFFSLFPRQRRIFDAKIFADDQSQVSWNF